MNEVAGAEFDSDTEAPSNTIGASVPLRWYDRLDLIGYDLEGKPIPKPVSGAKVVSKIDDFLARVEDDDYWRTVYDSLTGRKIVLSEEDVRLARSLSRSTHLVDDPHRDWDELFNEVVETEPLIDAPPSKRRFVPSVEKHRAIGRLVHAIKSGWIRPESIISREFVELRKPRVVEHVSLDLWARPESERSIRPTRYLPAPKMIEPGHDQSYRPSLEYTADRRSQETFGCLRHVPTYDNFVEERFERCLDLYMCARKLNMRARFDPRDLLTQATRDLPRACDLRPYPISCTRRFYGHSSRVTAMDVEHNQGRARFASATANGEVFVWQIWSERRVGSLRFEGEKVESIAWNPVMNGVFAVGTKTSPKIRLCLHTNSHPSRKLVENDLVIEGEGWTKLSSSLDPNSNQSDLRVFAEIDNNHHSRTLCLNWHPKGDYLVASTPSRGLVVHQLSRCRSHVPYFVNKKTGNGKNNLVRFHPNKPFLIVSHNNSIVLFDMSNQSMVRQLLTGARWPITTLTVHHGGDHILAGSSDGFVHWFDLDYGDKPFRTLTYHQNRALASSTKRENAVSITASTMHQTLPLMASASAEGTVIVAHASVYDDFTKNPMIVPVKRLWAAQAQQWSQKILKTKGNETKNVKGKRKVLCAFDKTHPWILTSNGSVIALFTETNE